MKPPRFLRGLSEHSPSAGLVVRRGVRATSIQACGHNFAQGRGCEIGPHQDRTRGTGPGVSLASRRPRRRHAPSGGHPPWTLTGTRLGRCCCGTPRPAHDPPTTSSRPLSRPPIQPRKRSRLTRTRGERGPGDPPRRRPRRSGRQTGRSRPRSAHRRLRTRADPRNFIARGVAMMAAGTRKRRGFRSPE